MKACHQAVEVEVKKKEQKHELTCNNQQDMGAIWRKKYLSEHAHPQYVNPSCMVAEVRRTQGSDEGEAPIWTVVSSRKQLQGWTLEKILSSAEWREGVLGTGQLRKWRARLRYSEMLHWRLWRGFSFFHVAAFSSLVSLGHSGCSHQILYWTAVMSLYYLISFLPSVCLLYHSAEHHAEQAVSHRRKKHSFLPACFCSCWSISLECGLSTVQFQLNIVI